MSTNFVTPTTELEAINEMLRAIGESPLDDLNQSFADSDVAMGILRSELRAVQNFEWTWNTEVSVTLAPDANGHVNLPPNVIRVICDPVYSQRGLLLYDRVNHTYEFTDSILCDLIVALNFDEIPEAARRFVTIRSVRRFINDIQPDQVTSTFKSRDEQSAWASLLNYEAQTAQWNMLSNSPLNNRIKRFRASAGLTMGVRYGRE